MRLSIARNPENDLWYVRNDEGAWCLLPIGTGTSTHVAEALCTANIPGGPFIETVRLPEGATFGPAVERMTMVTSARVR